MRHTIAPLKTTLIGGALFLVPLVLVVAIVGYAVGMAYRILKPLAEWTITFNDPLALSLAGVAAVMLVILLCFLGGVAARWALAQRVTQWIEDRLNDIYPRYAVLKSMAQGYGLSDGGHALIPVLARYDDRVQIAFEVERAKNGLVTLFLPGSPDPWAGTIAHMTAERITPLDTDFDTVMKSLQWLGRGSAVILDKREVGEMEKRETTRGQE